MKFTSAAVPRSLILDTKIPLSSFWLVDYSVILYFNNQWSWPVRINPKLNVFRISTASDVESETVFGSAHFDYFSSSLLHHTFREFQKLNFLKFKIWKKILKF